LLNKWQNRNSKLHKNTRAKERDKIKIIEEEIRKPAEMLITKRKKAQAKASPGKAA